MQPRIASSTLGFLSLTLLAGAADAQCEVQKLHAPDPEVGDSFGYAVALDGDVLAISAPAKDEFGAVSGAVYLYRGEQGLWRFLRKVVPHDPGQGDYFGFAVERAGERWFAGAVGDDDLGESSGSVYVYERSGTAWLEVQKILAIDGGSPDGFGWALAAAGDTLFIGAPYHGGKGAVYRYERGGGGYAFAQKLLAGDGEPNERFGCALALDGDLLAVGARWDDDLGARAGSAYIFERAGADWVERAKVLASDGGPGECFGVSVAVEGERILVGADHFDSASGEPGAAYVFERAGASWVEGAKLEPSDGAEIDHFGHAVAAKGGKLLVGAYRHDSAGLERSGAVYIFEHDGAAWLESAKLAPSDSIAYQWFGYALETSDDHLVIGSYVDSHLVVNSGSAYVFSLAGGQCASSSYCFGIGCPCGNDDPAAGCANSTGAGGLLSSYGTTSVALDDLVLSASSLPPNRPGIFYMGPAPMQLPMGDGWRCVGGSPTFRWPVLSAGPLGVMTLGPGIAAGSCALFPSSGCISAGSTWHFQSWYRDPGGPCGQNFDLTNALALAFTP